MGNCMYKPEIALALPNGGRRETKNCHAYQSHLHRQDGQAVKPQNIER